MPRIPDKNINYAEIGRLVLDYWSGRKGSGDFETEIRNKVSAVYAKANQDPPKVTIYYESRDEIIISVPYNPWQDEQDPSKFAVAEDMTSYQNELGIVVFGGCR